ncbi:MAG: SDR family oxidoreductase [Chitinophagaceae bacterium]
MNILITGANGYIGRRLTAALLKQGHSLTCCVRNKWRFEDELSNEKVKVLEVDFLDQESNIALPQDLDAAYFLVHSMREGAKFSEIEKKIAERFLQLISTTSCRQIIYLSGIVNEEALSQHLSSRLQVENILRSGPIPATVLRAGIIVGSGSSSFEIIRDLVEKLPVMIVPKWVETKCQPIAIRNVIEYMTGVLLKEKYFNSDHDIGGPEILTYKEMMLQFAEVRKLKRKIITVPVMTPKLSSYWLYFVTSTSYSLAQNLVDSMKVNVVCRPNNMSSDLGVNPITYREAVQMAFQKIEQNEVVSSWKDAFSVFNTNTTINKSITVPTYGTFKDKQQEPIGEREEQVFSNIWKIGGDNGWYYGNTLWKARGFLDKAFGGVGLRRGRTHKDSLHSGDSLDFWRVLVADRKEKRLLLYAEMKMPGEAWLEFKRDTSDGKVMLVQTATFRPRGLLGRLYWYSMLPFHYFIFKGMIRNITREAPPVEAPPDPSFRSR